ncbi:hypothetical protein GJW-30_1_00010 [Variibacter gotjawalensis]|uniref:Acid shock protein n=1 Tax=Variibacter gotjawalensis TaxID=1333996 RepID=A0A0S3PNL1_9BRAD|nr:hypothetical protein [Variibacter gotjawalensis]NIK47789.1 hypothetical protein [Variibacter gotjawalensis]RZS49676.1 hypothetical protein EV661_2115 [Variibacter gotjawalensis]BAT57505.1 hypothetical protein GJW-30_1_00010 [Variibacter gotjawalensis]
MLKIVTVAGAAALLGLGTLGASAAAPVGKMPTVGQTIEVQGGSTRVPRAKPKKMKSQKTKGAPPATMPKSTNQ